MPAGEKAASRVRVWLLAVVKLPPTYTVPSAVTAMARARAFSAGLKASRAPVPASSAATRYRFTPLTWVKSPTT